MEAKKSIEPVVQEADTTRSLIHAIRKCRVIVWGLAIEEINCTILRQAEWLEENVVGKLWIKDILGGLTQRLIGQGKKEPKSGFACANDYISALRSPSFRFFPCTVNLSAGQYKSQKMAVVPVPPPFLQYTIL